MGYHVFFIDVAKFSNTNYISKNNLGLAISIFVIKRAHSATDSNKWVYTIHTNLLFLFVCLYPTCLFKPTRLPGL